MRPDETHAVDEELVSLGLTTDHRVVIEDQHPTSAKLLKERGGAESGEPASDDDEVVAFAGIDRTTARRLAADLAVAKVVGGRDSRPNVDVRACIVADTPEAFPTGVGRGRRLRQKWRLRIEQQRPAGKQRRVEEVSARDGHVETQVAVFAIERLARVGRRHTKEPMNDASPPPHAPDRDW